MADQDSFNAGRRGDHAGSGTDMGEFRGGQNANRIDQENAKSANTSYLPRDRGGGGGGALDWRVLLWIGAIIIWPVAIMAVVAAMLLFALRRWPAINGTLTFGEAFRKLYMACLAFWITFAGVGFVATELFWPESTASTIGAGTLRATAWLLTFILAVLVSAWTVRTLDVSNSSGTAESIRVALALVLPASAISIIALVWVSGTRLFN